MPLLTSFLLASLVVGPNETTIRDVLTKVDVFFRAELKAAKAMGGLDKEVLLHWKSFMETALAIAKAQDQFDALTPPHLVTTEVDLSKLDEALAIIEGKMTEIGAHLGNVQGWIRTGLNRSTAAAADKGALRVRLDMVDATLTSIVREARARLEAGKLVCAYKRTDLTK